MLVKWKPFYGLNTIERDMEDLFGNIMNKSWSDSESFNLKSWAPAIDITENEKEIKVKASIPGMDQKDIEVHLEENTLTIKGEKKEELKEEKENYLRKEMSYGSFYRGFTLPSPVKEEEITATYKNGILEIVLPKEEEAKPTKIEVK